MLVFTAIVTMGAALLIGWGAIGVLILLLLWGVITTRQYVAHLGWAEDDEVVMMKSGWIWRQITLARVNKIQAVAMHQTPFDRRAAMARVRVDTAGAGGSRTGWIFLTWISRLPAALPSACRRLPRIRRSAGSYASQGPGSRSRKEECPPKELRWNRPVRCGPVRMLALLLMVGFYVFALAIAGGLLWVPYAEVTYAERINGRLTLFCIIGGRTILWALVPRIDKFEAPGPRLTPANAPKLFDMINDVAKATSQPRPEDVYLLADVNAFVTHRGGMMGFGSRRVMGIGLPLIKGLSPAELRSVIAHEFGHYVSGDVALGPWIHKTRAAIGRTLHHLGNNWLLTHSLRRGMRGCSCA